MRVQAFVTELAVERFDKGVVGRLAKATEVPSHPVDAGRVIQRFRDKFLAIVYPDLVGRHAALEQEPIHDINDPLALGNLVDMDRQELAGLGINHRQRAEAATVEQGVGDKVNCSDSVRTSRQ